MLFFVSFSTGSSAFFLMKGYIFSAFFEMYILDKTVVIIYMYRYRIKFLVVRSTTIWTISWITHDTALTITPTYFCWCASINVFLYIRRYDTAEFTR